MLVELRDRFGQSMHGVQDKRELLAGPVGVVWKDQNKCTHVYEALTEL